MNLAVTVFSVLELLVGALGLVVAYVAWGFRDTPGGVPLFAMANTAVVYALASAFASALTDPLWWELAETIQYPLTAGIAVGSLFFALEFTHRDPYARSELLALLGGVLLASLGTALTSPVHDLLIAERGSGPAGLFVAAFGPLFWVNTLVSLSIILSALTLLAVELVESEGIYRAQITAVIVASLLGVGFFLWQSLAPIHPAFNLATVGIVGWCGVTLWGVFRFELLETSPIASETLMDSIDAAVVALNTDDRIVEANEDAAERFDVGPHDVGRPVADALGDYPALLEPIEARASERDVTIREDGQDRYLHVEQSPLSRTHGRLGAVDERERPVGRTIVIRDVTERRRREWELERQNERLEEFASVVSHDLRNPLNVAEGRVDLAREDCDSEHLDAALQAHDRMETLIDDLLALARSGDSTNDVRPVDLGDLVDRCWLHTRAEEATLRVETDRTVPADRNRLQQLFENLFRNAVEHGGADVTVTVGDLPDGFYVADDGPGIPEGERERVFDGGYSLSDGGTGLGLNIVSQIVATHGWDVDVTDSDDGGARFEITGVGTVEGHGTGSDGGSGVGRDENSEVATHKSPEAATDRSCGSETHERSGSETNERSGSETVDEAGIDTPE
ncbi:histidine kinase N-terminal 7TM domain-containing protein [Halobellus limi]|uniref:histidine kinase n=1 Tax=Halobellus limi TaxID=699433 RepID=A0A1H5T6M6_9EURY|nr:histidine kinase N-terminal 7TM domain-containing protein [Halobellus limi]QCC47389.1 hypothetical protein DV707_06780 [Halobellus limi]SEF58483.1 PAS/PAC sensor signal transduction histidine kinase [Halobellus limi]